MMTLMVAVGNVESAAATGAPSSRAIVSAWGCAPAPKDTVVVRWVVLPMVPARNPPLTRALDTVVARPGCPSPLRTLTVMEDRQPYLVRNSQDLWIGVSCDLLITS